MENYINVKKENMQKKELLIKQITRLIIIFFLNTITPQSFLHNNKSNPQQPHLLGSLALLENILLSPLDKLLSVQPFSKLSRSL